MESKARGQKSEVGPSSAVALLRRVEGLNKLNTAIDHSIIEKERKNDFELTRTRRFTCRTRYPTDSGIIGGKAFVSATYRKVKEAFHARREKIPKPISGFGGIYSLKRLTE